MKNKISKGVIAVLTVLLVLLIDQLSKIWVKTHMALYDSFDITNWFKSILSKITAWHSESKHLGKCFCLFSE